MTAASIAYPGANPGIHFTNPWLLNPYIAVATSLKAYDSGGIARDMTTTNFFTEMARRGLQEQTNWASNTYKTLLSVSSGAGLVAAIVGPTAGGAETTTFEVTVDGVVSTLVVAGLASGSRAVLTAAMVAAKDPYNDGFAEAGMILAGGEALDANKQVFTATPTAASILLPWAAIQLTAVPCLRFSKSLLIRAKHSASITNSTATAYSAVQYRLGL